MVLSDETDIPILKKKRSAGRFATIFVLSILGVGGWTGWKYLLQTPPEDSLVVLRADDTPFRVKPAANSQAEIPNQDSTFMNLIDGSSEAHRNSEVISLADPPPEPPPVFVTKPKEKIAQTVRENNPASEDANERSKLLTQKAETDKKRFADKDSTSTGGQSRTGSIQENIISTEVEQSKPEVVDLTAAMNSPAMPTPRPKVPKSGQIEMMVQLAAFRKEDKAKTAAALLNQKHADRLRGHQLDVRSIKSTDGQLFWRVITDPIPKEDALSICDGLKRAGQDCIIRQIKAQKP